MKTLLFILTGIILSTISIIAQQPIPQPAQPIVVDDGWQPDTSNYTNLFDNGFGVRYSSISGYGVSILRRFLDDYTICVSGMIFYNEQMKWSDMSKSVVTVDKKEILYNYGLEVQRDLFKTNKTKFYALIGFYNSVEDNTRTIKDFERVELFSVGAGLGFQWYWGQHVASYFQFGYKYNNKDTRNYEGPGLERLTTIGFGLGLSILY